jgi:hypothetical protein
MKAGGSRSGKRWTRFLVAVLAILIWNPVPANATVSFACDAEDATVKFVVDGAYGTDLGSGLAAFGADITILMPSPPQELRELHLDHSHVRQQWLVGRDIKILLRWAPVDQGPYREVILIIEAQRGEDEESAYLGRYSLRIRWRQPDPGAEPTERTASGAVSCASG